MTNHPCSRQPSLHAPSSSFTQVLTFDFDDTPSQQHDHVLRQLQDVGVDLLKPLPSDNNLTDAMGDFAEFCLQRDNFTTVTLPILLKYTQSEDSEPPVGELQGGGGDDSNNKSSNIFRVVLPSLPIQELLQTFYQRYPNHKNVLTEQSTLEYMLQKCNDARRNVHPHLHIQDLGNPMFIFSRGGFSSPPFGQQIPHIDHCQPNVQVGMFLSRNSPATLVMESSHAIDNVQDLIEYWRQQDQMPALIADTLFQLQDVPLNYGGTFQEWSSLNTHLGKFGKLFSKIEKVYRVTNCPPGTTLLAHDNPIHAGPPFSSYRMFVYAIGIPENETVNDRKNDGEIQYNQLLLHVDLCSILFTTWNDPCRDSMPRHIQAAKRYLLDMLPDMIREFPYETFQRLLPEERAPLREWLYDLWEAVVVVNDEATIDGLLERAVRSETIVICPQAVETNAHSRETRRKARQQRRQQRRQS